MSAGASTGSNARQPPGTATGTATGTGMQTSRRLLIFQEARNPHNIAETVYLPVNKLGLPICGDGPELPSILELPLRVLRVFTELFNQPKYKGWSVLSAGPYHDTSEEGKFYAVVLEQVVHVSGYALNESHIGSP
ncbi:hypothetical protein N7461_000734 [Penicillium sp. DV-2018c]|nr:hypothetical protein N7461_000734 [Penicillium sp. DV-2018c]